MAVASFGQYNARVQIANHLTADVSKVILPCDKVIVKAIPYVGAGKTIVQLFDGSNHSRLPTWGYTVELQWNNMSSGNLVYFQEALIRMMENIDASDPVNIYLKQTNTGATAPTFDPTRVILDVLVDIRDTDIQAIFTKRFRNRKASLFLRTKLNNLATPYAWLSD